MWNGKNQMQMYRYRFYCAKWRRSAIGLMQTIQLTDSMAFSKRKISSCNKCNVPVFPRCRANAAAQALWMLFTQFSNSTFFCFIDVGLPSEKKRIHTKTKKKEKKINFDIMFRGLHPIPSTWLSCNEYASVRRAQSYGTQQPCILLHVNVYVQMAYLTWRLEQIRIAECRAQTEYVVAFRMLGYRLHNCTINND